MSMAFSIYPGPVLRAADADRAGNGILTPITTTMLRAYSYFFTDFENRNGQMDDEDD